jgi:hypothetical protein
MIKYADIKDFSRCGEVGRHLYQWLETKASNEDGNKIAVIIRAYDCESKIWVGYVLINQRKIINLPNQKIDLTDVTKILGDIKKVKSFKEFIKGSCDENFFKDFKEV